MFGGTRRYHRDYGTCTGIAELNSDTEVLVSTTNLYWYFVSYLYYEVCHGLMELILVLRSIYLSYGSYPCAKVPVDTISRN